MKARIIKHPTGLYGWQVLNDGVIVAESYAAGCLGLFKTSKKALEKLKDFNSRLPVPAKITNSVSICCEK